MDLLLRPYYSCGFLNRSARYCALSHRSSWWRVQRKGCRTSATKKSGGIYDNPDMYDMAFSCKDVNREVEFLKNANDFLCGRKASNALELGCGPARHSIGLAKSGLTVFSLDVSSVMLDYAKEQAENEGVTLKLIRADMCGFDIPGAQQIDLAFCMTATISHLLTNERVLEAFRSVHKVLSNGGLLVLELAHPDDVFDRTLIDGEAWDNTSEELAAPTMIVEYGQEGDFFDPVQQVIHKTIILRSLKGDTLVEEMQEIVLQRLFTFQELELLAQLSGFTVVAAYGDVGGSLDSCISLQDAGAWRMILCLQKPL